jgi:hypothetical protein
MCIAAPLLLLHVLQLPPKGVEWEVSYSCAADKKWTNLLATREYDNILITKLRPGRLAHLNLCMHECRHVCTIRVCLEASRGRVCKASWLAAAVCVDQRSRELQRLCAVAVCSEIILYWRWLLCCIRKAS